MSFFDGWVGGLLIGALSALVLMCAALVLSSAGAAGAAGREQEKFEEEVRKAWRARGDVEKKRQAYRGVLTRMNCPKHEGASAARQQGGQHPFQSPIANRQ